MMSCLTNICLTSCIKILTFGGWRRAQQGERENRDRNLKTEEVREDQTHETGLFVHALVKNNKDLTHILVDSI